MMISPFRWFLIGLASGLGIASCAGPPPEPTATPPALALETAVMPSGSPPVLQLAEASPAAATEESGQAPEAPAVPAEAAPLYQGIPHGVTSEGFFYLGQPGAPITLTDYSDFL